MASAASPATYSAPRLCRPREPESALFGAGRAQEAALEGVPDRGDRGDRGELGAGAGDARRQSVWNPRQCS
eukprot:1195449-Prorocentrum_minimum.AAC.4